MRLEPTRIAGVALIALEPVRDERGFFARAFCRDELAAQGIAFDASQINLSRNEAAGTLRGMHWQDAPFSEAKIVRVVRGAAFDVVADLRRDSPTFMQWQAFELDAVSGSALYVPEGCAHGFLTHLPETDVLYLMGRAHVPGRARGFRYDDPAFGIAWPAEPRVVGAADLAWPRFRSGS